MALLAETLIDEWLNRRGFLTMRGLKNKGVDEIDLLGVRRTEDGVEGWHVEAQISFRPVGYITKLPAEYAKASQKSANSAVKRPEDLLAWSVAEFVEKKFNSKKKHNARNAVWPNLQWKRIFVHGIARDEHEIDLIRAEGVEVIPFHVILAELAVKSHITGAAGTDISEIIEYFDMHRQS